MHSIGLGEREGEQVELVDIGLYWPELLPLEPFPELPQAPVWLEFELAELQLEDWPEVELAELQFPPVLELAAEAELPGEAKDEEEVEDAEEEEEDEEEEEEEISGGS